MPPLSTPDARVAIPGDQVPAVRASLLELYQVCADALSHSTARYLEAENGGSHLEARRDELAVLDRLLGQLGWPRERPAGEPAVLCGPLAPIREALWLALTHASAALDEAARGYWDGATALGALTAALETARVRLELLAEVD